MVFTVGKVTLSRAGVGEPVLGSWCWRACVGEFVLGRYFWGDGELVFLKKKKKKFFSVIHGA